MPPKNPTTETLPPIFPSGPEFKTSSFSSKGSSSSSSPPSSARERRTTQSCVGKCTAATTAVTVQAKSEGTVEEDGVSVRERLKRHQMEVAGRVWIPEIWGQEEFLKDWIDCSAFDAALVGSRIVSAKAALVEDGGRANSGGFRIENSCRRR